MIGRVWTDVRYAFRRLRKSSGFATTAVLTLALGIGATTAVFSIIHSVMLKSLPVVNPQQLYRLGGGADCCDVMSSQDGHWSIFSYPFYQHLKENTAELQNLAAFEKSVMDLSVTRENSTAPADPFGGEFVSGNYFQLFDLKPIAGRLLTPADDAPNAPAVAVMSYRVWRDRYGQDLSVIGSTFYIRSIPMTVVGIAPPGFFGDTVRPDPPDFWFPISTDPQLHGSNTLIKNPDQRWLYVIGRVGPGTSSSAVEAHVTVELRQWLTDRYGTSMTERLRSAISRQSIYLSPGGGGIMRMSRIYGDGLRYLMIISIFVLLIACMNVANLLLARASAARVQLSVRVALGASRMSLIQQSFIESLILGLCGGVVGLLGAYGGVRFIVKVAFRGTHFVPITGNLSTPVLLFSLALSIIAGIIFSVTLTWTATRAHPAEALRGVNRSSGRRSSFLQEALVVLQVAMSVTLLTCAGLLTHSLEKLQHQDFGFETENRLMVKLNPAAGGYSAERLPELYRKIQEKLTNVPGILSASFSMYSPMEGTYWDTPVFIEGEPVDPDRKAIVAWDRIGPHYFETVGTKLLQGRAIDEHDTPTSRAVAVVNRVFAEKFFPHQNPVGRHFGMGDPRDAGSMEIIGVVENAKYFNAREAIAPMFFRPLLQMDPLSDKTSEVRSTFVYDIEIRSAAHSASLEPLIREAIREVDPNMAVLDVITFEDQVATYFNRESMVVGLSALFGVLALAIASIGLYAVMSYIVVQRTAEIGMRMALGATRYSVLGLVLKNVLNQAGIGLVLGLLCSALMGRLLSSQLYGVRMFDPAALLAVAISLVLTALAAGMLPATRAASVNPSQALRSE